MKRKRMSRVISMLLVAAMLFTMTGVSAFAEGESGDSEESTYLLAFGDSTSSGYMLPDFNDGQYPRKGFSQLNNDLEEWTYDRSIDPSDPDYNNARISAHAFPWLMKKHIADVKYDGDKDKVYLSSLCLDGMRSDELRAMLDIDFYRKGLAKDLKHKEQVGNKGQGFLTSHMDYFMRGLGPDRGKAISEESIEALHEYVENEVKKADVIVLDNLTNNFGTYLGFRLGSYLEIGGETDLPNTVETIEDVDDVPDSIKARLVSLRDRLKKQFPMFGEGIGNQLLEAYFFGAASCIVNFKANIAMIRELNPNAEIVVVGLTNQMKGLKIDTGDGSEIDFGDIAGTLYSMINSYVRGLDPNSGKYYFADPGQVETFASSIADADSYEELLANGGEQDYGDYDCEDDEKYGMGAFAIGMMYQGFVDSFMGGSTDSIGEMVYGTVTGGINSAVSGIQEGAKAEFPKWSALTNEVTFRTNLKVYLTADNNPVFSTDDDSITATNPLITKGLLINQLGGEAQAKMFYEGTAPFDGNTQGAPLGLQPSVKQLAPNAEDFPAWDDMGINDPVSFNPGTLYATFDKDEKDITKAINFSYTSDGITPLTKQIIQGVADSMFRPAVEEMLYEAAAKHGTLAYSEVAGALSGGVRAVANKITQYLAAKLTGSDNDPELDEGVWGLLNIEERFLLYNGVGSHPDTKGAHQKYEAIAKAYDEKVIARDAAYDDLKEEVQKMLKDLKALLDNTPAGEDIDKIIETLDKIEAALPMLDEAQMTLEEINAIKAQFYDYYGQALDLLGITEEDLINQGKFIAENVDWEQLAEWIKKMNEIAQQYPELREKYEPVIREYAEKIYDFVDKAMDEIIKAKDKIDVDKIMEYIQTAEDIIDQIKEVIKNAPTEAEIREKLEELQKIVEEKVREISEELYEQLKAISEQLNDFVDGIDYEQILEELQPIMDQIKEMGIAVYQLPEYEKIIDEYAEVLAKLGNDSAELKDEVSALLEQVEDLKKQTEDKSALIAKLTAKAIRPDLVTKVTFPSGKVKVTLSWDKDPDAAGYVLTVNGEKKEFKETTDGFIYEDTAAEVGTTYKFEVVPYVTYNGETINGKTFKASVVPKVKLKKAVIKKIKAGNKSFKVKWKKVSGASGYKVSYKLGKKTKYKTVKGGKKVSLKVKKLTSGKKYTVKVRAWKKVNGKKYYGKWSKAKKVTVK